MATISAALLLLLAHNGFPWTSPTSTFAGRVRPTDGIDPFRSERLPGNIRAMVGDPRVFVTPSLIRGRHYILRRTHFHLEGYISNGSADGTLAGHPHGGPTVRKPTSGSHVCTTGFALHEAGQRCPYTAWRPVNPQPYGRSARRRICHLTPVSLCSCYGAAPTRCRNGPGPRKLNGHGTGSASDTGARSGQGATAESPTYSSEGISGSNSSHSPESSSLRRVCRRSSYVEAALYAQAAPMWREA